MTVHAGPTFFGPPATVTQSRFELTAICRADNIFQSTPLEEQNIWHREMLSENARAFQLGSK